METYQNRNKYVSCILSQVLSLILGVCVNMVNQSVMKKDILMEGTVEGAVILMGVQIRGQ
jgi:hypothetical protein